MAIAHTVTDKDTLQSLAVQYLGDILQWQTIADYNNLDYPYLAKDDSELSDLFGHGYVTVTRATYSSAVTIKKGWTFKTKPSIFVGGLVKIFEVSEDTVIPAGVATYYIPLKCTIPGTYGNIMEYMITEVGDDIIASGAVQFTDVHNEKAFIGGRDLNIKITGDIIYIPTDTTEVTSEDLAKIEVLVGGEDLILDAGGEPIFQTGGDLATVSGTDNIMYAVSARLSTELGALKSHPEYGAELVNLIGTPNIVNREKLAEISVLRALKQEDRIDSPAINSVTIVKDKIYIDISYKISSVSDTAYRLQLTV